jgi:uncharacterized membrane protein YbhN (UPF0104 family)
VTSPSDKPAAAAPGSPRRPERPFRRRLLLSVVLLIVTLAGVGLVTDLTDLGPPAQAFDRRLLLPILFLAPANYAFRYWKWTILLRRAGLALPPRLSLIVFLAGLSMTVTPAKAGELIKAHYLKETLDVPYAVSTPVIVAERVLDSVAVLVLALAGAVALAGGAGDAPSGSGAPPGTPGASAIAGFGLEVVAVAAAGLLLVVVFLRSSRGPVVLAGLARRLPAVGPAPAAFIEAFGAQSRRLLDPWTFTSCTLIGVVSWALEGLVVYLTLAGLGWASSPILGIFIVALASLAGAVSMLPGGAGAAEATILGLLSLYGYPRAIAGATTIVTRAATLWLGVAIGVAGLALAEREVRKQRRTPN